MTVRATGASRLTGAQIERHRRLAPLAHPDCLAAFITSLAMPTLIRLASLVSVALGAVGSLVFMFRVGRHNPSAILMILFTLWVVAPFAAMVSAPMLFKKWSVGGRAWFHFFTIVVALGSCGIYGDIAFGTPRPQPAFMFLVVPCVSLFVIGVASLIASLVSRSPHDKIA